MRYHCSNMPDTKLKRRKIKLDVLETLLVFDIHGTFQRVE